MSAVVGDALWPHYFAVRLGFRSSGDPVDGPMMVACRLSRDIDTTTGKRVGCLESWDWRVTPGGADLAQAAADWRDDHLQTHPEVARTVAAQLALRADFEASRLEIQHGAPDPESIVSAEVVERIKRAAVEAQEVLTAACILRDRWQGLHDEIWQQVRAACTLGVPDDFCWPVYDACGWSTVRDLVDAAKAALEDVV